MAKFATVTVLAIVGLETYASRRVTKGTLVSVTAVAGFLPKFANFPGFVRRWGEGFSFTFAFTFALSFIIFTFTFAILPLGIATF